MTAHVWKEIKGNPNLYSWVPISKKQANLEDIKIEDINIQDIPPIDPVLEVEDLMFEISEKIENRKKKVLLKKIHNESFTNNELVSVDDPEKYKIVKDFIIRKGLKVYGGAGINMYLKRKDKIYNPRDIPDYDFYSTDAWNDAVELADIFYEKGYKYSEARAGIHKGTYKVFVNLWPVADITFINKEDFEKIKTKKIQGMMIVSPLKLLESIYKEFSNPYANPSRWPKIAVREKLLTDSINFWNKKAVCSKDVFRGGIDKVDDELEKMLGVCYKFIKKRKLILIGSLAYNTFIEIGGGDKRLIIDNYKVLSEKADEDIKTLFTELLLINPNLETTTIYLPAKDLNYVSYSIIRNNELVCEIAQLTTCIPFKTIFGLSVGSIDYIKYEILFGMVYGNKKEVKDGRCLLKYLTFIQYNYYKNKGLKETSVSPFQRFVINCKGPMFHPLKIEILNRWLQKEIDKKKVIKEYEKDYIIKKYPKKVIPEECKDKNKEDCKYPCAWNKYIGRCTGIPLGIYKAGEDNSEIYKKYIE